MRQNEYKQPKKKFLEVGFFRHFWRRPRATGLHQCSSIFINVSSIFINFHNFHGNRKGTPSRRLVLAPVASFRCDSFSCDSPDASGVPDTCGGGRRGARRARKTAPQWRASPKSPKNVLFGRHSGLHLCIRAFPSADPKSEPVLATKSSAARSSRQKASSGGSEGSNVPWQSPPGPGSCRPQGENFLNLSRRVPEYIWGAFKRVRGV